MTAERRHTWVDLLRLFTAPLVAVTGCLVTVLLWVYNVDRNENKEFQKALYEKMDTGFREMAQEFKSVRQDEANYRQKTDSTLASVTTKVNICCAQRNYGKRETLTDTILY